MTRDARGGRTQHPQLPLAAPSSGARLSPLAKSFRAVVCPRASFGSAAHDPCRPSVPSAPLSLITAAPCPLPWSGWRSPLLCPGSQPPGLVLQLLELEESLCHDRTRGPWPAASKYQGLRSKRAGQWGMRLRVGCLLALALLALLLAGDAAGEAAVSAQPPPLSAEWAAFVRGQPPRPIRQAGDADDTARAAMQAALPADIDVNDLILQGVNAGKDVVTAAAPAAAGGAFLPLPSAAAPLLPPADAPGAAGNSGAVGRRKSLQRQWADALNLQSDHTRPQKRAARQNLRAALPKGMASVHRDGPKVAGALSGAALDQGGSFHERAAGKLLEAYMGKHGTSSSHVLLQIVVGLGLVLASCIVLVVSEVSVVSLVRTSAPSPSPESAPADGGAAERHAAVVAGGAVPGGSKDKDFPQAVGGGKGGTHVVQVKGSEVLVPNPAYMAYRPYVTLASMMTLFVGLLAVLSPACEVLSIIGLRSPSCILNVVFVALVVTLTGTGPHPPRPLHSRSSCA